MPVRDGRQFIEGLKARPREVWLDGERVQDVTEHPALKSSVRQLARLYDMQSDPHHRDILTYTSPSSGDAVGTSFMAAEDQEGLFKRRQAYRLWAEATFGMMGRAPDFMNITLLCFAEGRQVFARAGERFADNFVGYYEYCRENDVFLTHALVPPQTDRSRSSATQKDEYVNLGLKGETADGIIVQGARKVATLGPVADEVLIYNLPGLRPEDEKYALVFAVPLDVPGLRQICRQPYDAGGGSSYDHPLAANFEESDSLMIFDDVLVPWDRVFVHNSVAAANALFPDSNLRNYTAHQSAVRGLVKMQLAVGTAMALARRVKTDRFLHVQQMLGECLNYVEMVKSCIVRSEAECERTAEGTVRPLYAPLQAVRTSLPTWYPAGHRGHPNAGRRGAVHPALGRRLRQPHRRRHRALLPGRRGIPGRGTHQALPPRLGPLRRRLRHAAVAVRALLRRRPGAPDGAQLRELRYLRMRRPGGTRLGHGRQPGR